ncbi:helix-turn-helix domain-containing protein [Staphylococcus equorum]|uniref:helix-turn-helix domain-containing protein n=1 Tax=Staphylococcus equorum TaxID=246432 RepID=UPI0009C09C06
MSLNNINGAIFMEFKDLKIFQSVSDHESISRAAESLNYVQSHVTSRIKSLEQS